MKRSPVLGYNHNIRHGDRVWHVQTEDSGVDKPHIFTHLFWSGTILATRKIDYDPASAVEAVQRMMQTQHKGMLRDLKGGVFDDQIRKLFGEQAVTGEHALVESKPEPAQARPVPASQPVPSSQPVAKAPRPSERPAEPKPDKPSDRNPSSKPIRPVAPVVVARPAFVVGNTPAPHAPAPTTPPRPTAVRTAVAPPAVESSLDDAILAFLADDDKKER